mgnify:CR=1 FL=1
MNIHKYTIVEKLSSGAFGIIYKGQHNRNHEVVAIKTEPRDAESNSLKHEARIYQYLAGVKGIPSLKWFGYEHSLTCLVLPLFSESLKARKERLGHLSLVHTMIVAHSIVETLREIHARQLVHCDIKPDNFVLHGDDLHKIHIIDFGFTRRYRPEKRSTRSCIGTPHYMSRRVHQSLEPWFQDDIESLFYVLLFLHYKRLPWDEKNATPEKISESKHRLMGQLEILPTFFKQFAEYVNIGTSSTSPPDYQTIVSLFTC